MFAGFGLLLPLVVAAQAPEGVTLEGVELRAQPADPTQTDLLITAPRSIWMLKEHQAVFEGGVSAQRGELTLRCERLTVSYGEDNRFLSASASGGVEAVRGSYQAGGELALLDLTTGVLTLEGQPWLKDENNSLSGDRILFALDDERVECENCRLVVGAAVLRHELP